MTPGDQYTDEEIVNRASEAAESVIFDRFHRSEVSDVDITVTFSDSVLEVDVYVNVPDDREAAQEVAETATQAARSAVDELLEPVENRE